MGLPLAAAGLAAPRHRSRVPFRPARCAEAGPRSSGYGRMASQAQTVRTEDAVAISTDDAATRFAAP